MKLLVDRIDAIPLPDPRLTDDPKLPRVLVIGDSITMNYHEAAKAALKGIANYPLLKGTRSFRPTDMLAAAPADPSI